jgi:hypothetical protein
VNTSSVNVCIYPHFDSELQGLPILNVFTFCERQLDLSQCGFNLATQAIEHVKLHMEDYGLSLDQERPDKNRFVNITEQGFFGSLNYAVNPESPACLLGLGPGGLTLTGLTISIQVSSNETNVMLVAGQVDQTLAKLKESFPKLLRSHSEICRDDLIRSSATSLASLVTNLSEEGQAEAAPMLARIRASLPVDFESGECASLEDILYKKLRDHALKCESQQGKAKKSADVLAQVNEYNASCTIMDENS